MAHARGFRSFGPPGLPWTRLLIRLLPLLAAVVVAGCRTGPEHQAPKVSLPAGYRSATPTGLAESVDHSAAVSLAEWWHVFRDPTLDALMADATAANLEIRVAHARVREARALRGVVRSALFPSVDVAGSASRSRLSGNTVMGQQVEASGLDLEQDLLDAGLDMSWEIDVFGGRRRATEAAQAEWEAAGERGREVLVSVLAEVGWNYLEWRGAQRQLAVARGNLAAQEQTAALTRDRFQAGLASELDTARAEAQTASTRAQIPPLEETRHRAIHRLSVLLGRPPGEWVATADVDPGAKVVAPVIPVGLPSDLLRQRPDLRRAEREVASASARIGVAKAELLPKFYLTGAAGFQSLQAEDWLDGGSRFWSLGPSVRWPIFNAGRIRQQIRAENARHEQALLRYEQTVLTSLEEVENALIGFGQEQERRRALADAEAGTRRASVLANERYRGGLVDFLDVLDAERSLLAAQESLVQSDRLLGQHLVRLYKALGGGWSPDVPADASAQVGGLEHAERRKL
jgi:multidrug efflux system outer membrane protein